MRFDQAAPPRERVPPAVASKAELVEVEIALSPQAPGVARRAVVRCLEDRVAALVLEHAQLLVSELVTNSLRHSGTPAGGRLVLRVRVWPETFGVEVEDPGCDGVIAPHAANLRAGGGMGLNLVQSLSERCGVVRGAGGPTQVWALLRSAAPSDASATEWTTAWRG